MCRSSDDKINVEEFLRHVLDDAICKGVIESNHKTWSAEVRAHLLNTCIALASACSSGLASLRTQHDDVWSAGASAQVRRVDIVSQLLAIFASIFDQRYSSFVSTFAREPVPSECMDKVHRQYRFLPSNIPNWTRAVAAKFIEMEGFVRIFEVQSQLVRLCGVFDVQAPFAWRLLTCVPAPAGSSPGPPGAPAHRQFLAASRNS